MTWKESVEWGRPWNPITGCGRDPGCSYCYARRFASRLRGRFGYPEDEAFRPTFHPDKLDVPLRRKKATVWFVGSMAEMFGPGVRPDWVAEVLVKVAEIHEVVPDHKFLFLTKCPEGMKNYYFPSNAWCGITAEDQDLLDRRAPHLEHVDGCSIKFLSAEPLRGRIWRLPEWLDWIIIGAQSGPGAYYQDGNWFNKWVVATVAAADHRGIPVFMKENLMGVHAFRRDWQGGPLRKEMPFKARQGSIIAPFPDGEEPSMKLKNI